MIECEHIVIRAFLTSHEVSTFRASKLPEEFYAVKAEMEKRKTTFLSGDPNRQATQDPLMRGIYLRMAVYKAQSKNDMFMRKVTFT